MHVRRTSDRLTGERFLDQAVERGCLAACQLGGTVLSGAGGTLDRKYSTAQFGESGLDLMRKLKAVWDPNNIMNPGKAFFLG